MRAISRLLLLTLACGIAMPACAQLRCGEDDSSVLNDKARGVDLSVASSDPRGQLVTLVDTALRRSEQIGAATLLAQAAREDWVQASEAGQPSVNATVSGAAAGQQVGSVRQHQVQSQLSLGFSMPLWDAGRVAYNAAWRAQLAEASRQGLFNAQQQIAVQVVNYSLDRGRLLLQAQIYRQYMRRMACLVEALEGIVKVDKGRASELIQAQKSQMTAELSMEQTVSALRSTEFRLKRLVGDDLPPSASYATVLNQLPDIESLKRAAADAPDLLNLQANSRAQRRYAQSVAAQGKPQVNLGGTGIATVARPGSKAGEWNAGVSLTVPILQPGQQAAEQAARQRAEAAEAQERDSLNAKIYQMSDLYSTAEAALDRSRRIVDILRNSERLRAATLVQWQQMGRRSLFDVMGAESDYYSLRVAQLSTLFEAQQSLAMLWSMGPGVMAALR
ncbi:TolC family protein [Roseateles cellulosilyticus]|uniref:TolC family protein n=1 Tax=Pelomonas cellulosilytica TaxID=2906762 RepID=A0ABS8XZF3_9BURK|nr:TolC family protein [Pelomonas sp. P8]MCE4556124.1 TolC family protein [Pelomonas sp. P8]